MNMKQTMFSALMSVGACATASAALAHVPPSDDRRPASCPANAIEHALTKAAGDCFDLMPDLSRVWNGSCVYGPRGGHAVRHGCYEQGEHGRAGRLCGGHGVCFFGGCLCEPGFTGPVCTTATTPRPPCTPFPRTGHKYSGHQDACLINPEYAHGPRA